MKILKKKKKTLKQKTLPKARVGPAFQGLYPLPILALTSSKLLIKIANLSRASYKEKNFYLILSSLRVFCASYYLPFIYTYT